MNTVYCEKAALSPGQSHKCQLWGKAGVLFCTKRTGEVGSNAETQSLQKQLGDIKNLYSFVLFDPALPFMRIYPIIAGGF